MESRKKDDSDFSDGENPDEIAKFVEKQLIKESSNNIGDFKGDQIFSDNLKEGGVQKKRKAPIKKMNSRVLGGVEMNQNQDWEGKQWEALRTENFDCFGCLDSCLKIKDWLPRFQIQIGS